MMIKISQSLYIRKNLKNSIQMLRKTPLVLQNNKLNLERFWRDFPKSTLF